MSGVGASQALAGLSVVDLTRVRAGPTCVRQLADWGADVIKVEMRESDPASSTQADFAARHDPDFQNLHRNKRSIAIDLKHAAGLAIFRRLVARADVVVENYRPDVKHRLGIDYEALRAINKRLIYASISGFGQDGPYRERPGVDQIAQGMSGLMSITGEPGRGPMRAGIALADLSAGIFAAFGILAALYERQRSGEGQRVETSLLQAQIFMLDFQGARYLMNGDVPGQVGNNHPTGAPTGAYRTRDGHINIAPTPPMWRRFCTAMGRGDLIDHPDYATAPLRRKNRAALNALIEAMTVAGRQRNADRQAQRGRHSLRPDLFDRPDLRRPAGAPSRHRPGGAIESAGADHALRPAGDLEPHAEPAQPRRARIRRALRRDSRRARLRRRGNRRIPPRRRGVKAAPHPPRSRSLPSPAKREREGPALGAGG